MSPSPGLRLPAAQTHSFVDPPLTEDRHGERPTTPAAPPYSPITPVLTSTDLSSTNGRYPHAPPSNIQQPPPPIPFSESDNTDALALRSAISILQIQRRQSQRDMKALEEQKMAALADPVGFANAVVTGEVKTRQAGRLLVGPGPASHTEELVDRSLSGDMDLDENLENKATKRAPQFADIPSPQNVVRCPPVNWAKYHILGDPLDAMHEEQRRRPFPGQPHTDEEPPKAPEAVVAAPYSPWTDRLPETSMRTRAAAKKDG